MWFKSNPEKKALYREIRAAEKELARKRKHLRKLIDQFGRERDLSKARGLVVLAAATVRDIEKDILAVDAMIDRYNAM